MIQIILLSGIMLSVITMHVILMSVFLSSVVAPFSYNGSCSMENIEKAKKWSFTFKKKNAEKLDHTTQLVKFKTKELYCKALSQRIIS